MLGITGHCPDAHRTGKRDDLPRLKFESRTAADSPVTEWAGLRRALANRQRERWLSLLSQLNFSLHRRNRPAFDRPAMTGDASLPSCDREAVDRALAFPPLTKVLYLYIYIYRDELSERGLQPCGGTSQPDDEPGVRCAAPGNGSPKPGPDPGSGRPGLDHLPSRSLDLIENLEAESMMPKYW